MKQPELGRLIAELRKSKGLTQEELVSKCNLNVRTLQRIESGIVEPRSYTVRAIFAALEYHAPNFSENGLNKEAKRIRFGQIKEWFNLKTHIMAKVTILSAVVLAAGLTIFTIGECQAKRIEKDYVKDNSRGVMILRPKGLSHYGQYYLNDTLCIRAGKDLIQEYDGKIFLNETLSGYASEGDTVIYNKSTLFKKASLSIMTWAFQTIPGNTGIVYIFPKLPLSMANNIRGMQYRVGNDEIREVGDKILLNNEFKGNAYPGDTVIFRNGRLIFKQAVR